MLIWENKQCVTYDDAPMTQDKVANAFLWVFALAAVSLAMCLWGIQ